MARGANWLKTADTPNIIKMQKNPNFCRDGNKLKIFFHIFSGVLLMTARSSYDMDDYYLHHSAIAEDWKYILTKNLTPYFFLTQVYNVRSGKKGKKIHQPITRPVDFLLDYLAMFSQKRIRIVATSARVALPFGLSVVLVLPVIRPVEFAHCIAVVA